MTEKFKVGVIYGGESGEHEISLITAYWVSHHLNRNKFDVVLIGIDKEGCFWLNQHDEVVDEKNRKLLVRSKHSVAVTLPTKGHNTFGVDVIFPAIHGPLYEDGHLQGALTLAGLPFVGPELLTCANAMDKIFSKELVQFLGIPVVPWRVLHRSSFTADKKQQIAKDIIKDLTLPLIIKPANLGSSVGIHYVGQSETLIEALEDAFRYDQKILIEKALSARDLEVAVLENGEDPLSPRATVPGEIVVNPKYKFYSYEAKYEDPEGARDVIPADISPELTERCREYAMKIFAAFDGRGMARIDFLLDKTDSNLYFNEFNPIPGFTPISLYPKLWAHEGIHLPELIEGLIHLALLNNEKKKTLKRSYFD